MALEWNENLSVGLAQIDDQHKELIKRFNGLLHACRSGKGKERIVESFDFLGNYVISHFAEEERLMLLHDYPQRRDHIAHHHYLREKLRELRFALRKDGPSILQLNA